MSDLISRKALLEKLGVFSDRKNGNEHFLLGIETAVEIIESEPTVFDKEKVIEEIKNQFKLAETCASEPVTPLVEIFYVGQAIGYEESIKIVEKGGIE